MSTSDIASLIILFSLISALFLVTCFFIFWELKLRWTMRKYKKQKESNIFHNVTVESNGNVFHKVNFESNGNGIFINPEPKYSVYDCSLEKIVESYDSFIEAELASQGTTSRFVIQLVNGEYRSIPAYEAEKLRLGFAHGDKNEGSDSV